jgi:hypothetical protein
VKLLRVEDDHRIFHLAKQERQLLALMLGLYPVIPSAHQSLSKSAGAANHADQRLLDQALAEQRTVNKKLIRSFLADPRHFNERDDSVRMTVTAGEIEWLLQVLNDVRVGNWILLGSPADELPELAPNDPNAPQAWAMDLAGFFQMSLLGALNKSSSGHADHNS